MPFPTTTALPLLSDDMRVRTHTGTRKYTLLRSKVISLPLLFPIRKNLLSGNILKRQTGSLGRAFPLSPRSARAKLTRPREMPGKEG